MNFVVTIRYKNAKNTLTRLSFKDGHVPTHPEHDGLNLDVQVRRLPLLQRQLPHRPLQVEREGVEPQHSQRVQAQLHRVEVGEQLGRGNCNNKLCCLIGF